MLQSESELKSEAREQTNKTSTLVLSESGLDGAYNSAERFIRRKKKLATDFDFYSGENLAANDALFWFTCLFIKVRVGELDSQDVQSGAISEDTLLAKAGDDVTSWYRNAYGALRDVKASQIFRSANVARSNRAYTPDSYEGGQDTGSGGSNEVDASDL